MALDAGGAGRSGIQVIHRAVAILRILEEHRHGMSLGEIAKLATLPRATVQRIVETLESENIVTGLGGSAGVRLGPALIGLAAAARSNVTEIAHPHLAALARSVDETVDLSIYDNSKALFLDQIIGSQRLRAVSAIGKAFELHCAANGKAMLAAMTPTELEPLERKKLQRFTAQTITSWPNLKREVAAIRATGIAYDREEQADGICAVGAAFRAADRALYAISIPTPTQRFFGREAALADALLTCRRKLVSVLGGEP